MQGQVIFEAAGRRFESCRGHNPQVRTRIDLAVSNQIPQIHHKPTTYSRTIPSRVLDVLADVADVVLGCLVAALLGAWVWLAGYILAVVYGLDRWCVSAMYRWAAPRGGDSR